MSDEVAIVRERIARSVAVKQALLEGDHAERTARVAALWSEALRAGRKVIFCGNGGSAADATHMAAELVGRFELERAPLASLSLSDNPSALTAIANDYGFDEVFARQIRGLAVEGDVLVALSTSGTSPNVVAAVEAAREQGVRTVGFTRASGGRVGELVELCVRVPAEETARIQEATMLLLHAACELAERASAEAT